MNFATYFEIINNHLWLFFVLDLAFAKYFAKYCSVSSNLVGLQKVEQFVKNVADFRKQLFQKPESISEDQELYQ